MLEREGKLEGWFTGNTTRPMSREEKAKEERRKRLGRSLRKFKRTKDNPYIPEISSYIQHCVFDRVYDYMEKIIPPGFRVDYYMNLNKEWFVTSPSTTILFADELVSIPPQIFNGGKVWFRLFVNGVEKNYDLEVEWNEEKTDVKITREELRRLCHGISDEAPKRTVFAAPMTYELWQNQYRNIGPEPNDLYTNLMKDLGSAIKTLGLTEQPHVAEKAVSAIVGENPGAEVGSAEYGRIIGKVVMKYREVQRNGG